MPQHPASQEPASQEPVVPKPAARNGKEWANRRKLGLPTDRGLFVLTCMDERVDIERALGLEPGDAHVFRNAGGVVTDDVIRSAALATNFHGTGEIVVVLHTDCGQLTRSGEELAAMLDEKMRRRGAKLDDADIDPAVPELRLQRGAHGKWMRAFEDLDTAAREQVALLRGSPMIPDDVRVTAFVYDVGTGALREVVAENAAEMGKSIGS